MSSPDNYSNVILREFHAQPVNVIMQSMPSPNHSWNRWPSIADVRSGTVYGEGQFEQKEYLTGTMKAGDGGGTVVYTFVG